MKKIDKVVAPFNSIGVTSIHSKGLLFLSTFSSVYIMRMTNCIHREILQHAVIKQYGRLSELHEGRFKIGL